MTSSTWFWSVRRVAGLLFLLLLLWAGWSGYHHYTRLDRLLQEQASPNGALVARIWCRRHCDEPEILVLTLSPASRDIRRGIGCDNCDTLVPGGDIPGEDRIIDIRRTGPFAPRLRWRDGRTLIVSGPCMSDRAGQPLAPTGREGIRILFDLQGPEDLPAAMKADCTTDWLEPDAPRPA